MQIFHFRNFFFSVLKDFSGKTYEKTCRFYSTFPKYNSNWTCPPNFTLKFDDRLNLMGTFFAFPLLREKLWKDLQFFWLIFKYSIMIYTFTKICPLEICTKKMATVSKCLQFIIHFRNFEQHLQQNLLKDLSFLLHILKVPLRFYIFKKFGDPNLFLKKMAPVSICQ